MLQPASGSDNWTYQISDVAPGITDRGSRLRSTYCTILESASSVGSEVSPQRKLLSLSTNRTAVSPLLLHVQPPASRLVCPLYHLIFPQCLIPSLFSILSVSLVPFDWNLFRWACWCTGRRKAIFRFVFFFPREMFWG